jgi:hypothetical protein
MITEDGLVTTEKDALARATNNTLPEHLKQIAFADVMRGQVPQVLRKKDPGSSAYAPGATVQTLVLADQARATGILRAYARAGNVTGELSVVAPGTTPATGQISVQPDGNLMVLAADAITSLDVTYVPERGDVIELGEWSVVLDVLTLPAQITTRGAVLLLSVDAIEATSAGSKRILAPGASAPAAGACKFNAAKTTITFAAADAVTTARVKLLVCALIDLDTQLEAVPTIQ